MEMIALFLPINFHWWAQVKTGQVQTESEDLFILSKELV